MTAFTLGGITLTFTRNPRRPKGELVLEQADIKSAGGERIGRDYYLKNDLVELSWQNMPESDKTGLMSFWQSTARGMANAFDWTDTFGTAYTVRFATAQLQRVQERAYNAWAVTLRLRIL